MARPRKTGLEYFPLDCQLDTKVEMLRTLHGNDGFAVWIMLLQEAYQTENGEVDVSDIIRRKTLGKRADMDEETWSRIVSDSVSVGLFDSEAYSRGIVTSNGIKKRLGKVAQEREKTRVRKSGELSGGKPPENGGKKKEKEIDNKEVRGKPLTKKDTVPHSLEEVKRLFHERDYFEPEEQAEAFFERHESTGWLIGKARLPCKDWRQAAATWNRNAKLFASERKTTSRNGASENDYLNPD